MKKSTILIRQIEQKDAHSFSIEWSDGIVHHFRLSEIQRLCPCARCVDEGTGVRIAGSAVDPNVSAVRISSVGRYALKIEFTSGCSTGIYSFDMLYGLKPT